MDIMFPPITAEQQEEIYRQCTRQLDIRLAEITASRNEGASTDPIKIPPMSPNTVIENIDKTHITEQHAASTTIGVPMGKVYTDRKSIMSGDLPAPFSSDATNTPDTPDTHDRMDAHDTRTYQCHGCETATKIYQFRYECSCSTNTEFHGICFDCGHPFVTAHAKSQIPHGHLLTLALTPDDMMVSNNAFKLRAEAKFYGIEPLKYSQ